jgi:hypothetical protein
LAINYSNPRKSRMRWRPKLGMKKPASTGSSTAAADDRFNPIQAFFDTTRGQLTIG